MQVAYMHECTAIYPQLHTYIQPYICMHSHKNMYVRIHTYIHNYIRDGQCTDYSHFGYDYYKAKISQSS